MERLRGIWTTEKFTYKGGFYQFHDYPLSPKPLKLPNRPHPLMFQGRNSLDARENGANVCDYYFMNGNTLEGFQEQIADVKERARNAGREGQVRFAAKQAGASTGEKKGMWTDSKFENLVQYNDGFKTKLIGTKEQVADRIFLPKSLGIYIVLWAFLHYENDIERTSENRICHWCESWKVRGEERIPKMRPKGLVMFIGPKCKILVHMSRNNSHSTSCCALPIVGSLCSNNPSIWSAFYAIFVAVLGFTLKAQLPQS